MCVPDLFRLRMTFRAEVELDGSLVLSSLYHHSRKIMLAKVFPEAAGRVCSAQ